MTTKTPRTMEEWGNWVATISVKLAKEFFIKELIVKAKNNKTKVRSEAQNVHSNFMWVAKFRLHTLSENELRPILPYLSNDVKIALSLYNTRVAMLQKALLASEQQALEAIKAKKVLDENSL